MLAIAPRGHADRLQVGAGVGLGQRKSAADLAAGELRQPLRLLRRRAELLDRQRQHQVRVEDAGDRHPHARDPHHDLGVGRGRQAQPAVLGADGGAEQAQLLHLLDDLARIAVGVVVLLDDGLDVALDQRSMLRKSCIIVRTLDLPQRRLGHGPSLVSAVYRRQALCDACYADSRGSR